MKSYDRWEEVDENNNIINKGDEFNFTTDGYITGGSRRENRIFHPCVPM